MNKSSKKIIFILLIVILFIVLFALNNSVFAMSTLTGIVEDPGKTLPEPKIIEISNPILTLVQIVSGGIATGLIIFDGIKLLTTVDNSEKANLKRKLMYYAIGGVLIFAPATILKTLSSASTMI